MAILVTGGAGFIGSHTVLDLVALGESVVVLDDLSTGSRSAIPPSVKFVHGDIGNARLVAEIIAENRIDAIVHFAAKIVVPESMIKPLDYYLHNTAGSRTLLACAIEGGVKHFVFSSTAAVYGNPERSPVDEDEPTRPISPYGKSKLMFEWILQDAAKAHDIRFVALRYFNVAGADPGGRAGQSTPNASHLIKVAVQAALGFRPHLEVFGTDYDTPDGSCIRDYVHVTDLARAHADALRWLRDGGASLTCNCGYGYGYSVLEVVEAVKKISGNDFPVRISGRRPGDPAVIVASNARISSELGWRPQHQDLPTMIRHSLEWEKHLRSASPVATAGRLG